MESTTHHPFDYFRFLLQRAGRGMCLLVIFLFCFSAAEAKKKSPFDDLKTNNAQLDSLLVQLNLQTEWLLGQGIGKMDVYIDVKGYSYSEKQRWWTSLVRDALPFDHRPNDTTFLEATCKASYQTPCDLLISPVVIKSDHNRRSRKVLESLDRKFFPFYALHIMKDKGDDKEYVHPFSNDGIRKYNFESTDTTLTCYDTLVTIHFWPKREHHDLLTGEAVVRLKGLSITELRTKGRVDFGIATDTLYYEEKEGVSRLKKNILHIDYKYGKMRGHNRFVLNYDVRQMLPRLAFDPRLEKLDLSEIYKGEPCNFFKTTPSSQPKDSTKRRKRFIQQLPQHMINSTRIDAYGSDLRIYGPLNPASVGYDKLNGITLRERMRFSHLYKNGHSTRIMPEFGYAFKLKEFRYNVSTEWTYCPHHRGTLLFRARNGSNGFSSRFKDDVNRTIQRYREQLDLDFERHRDKPLSFDSLGLKFFDRHEFTLENSIELGTGLMFYMGTTYSIRKPIKHGVHARAQAVAEATINKRYLDMNPYIRLVWTPHQYYYFEGNQKLYLYSHWPTFSFEVGQGVKNILKSRANYCRLEFDAQQEVRIGSHRNLSWRWGAGGFFKQYEEYFVNYTYFSRSQYPSTWDHRTNGGAFALLDDYWYSSSPSYIQSHFMFESPFLLMHKWGTISKYIIKERIYISNLWAQGKNLYGEIGYGIGNNYFNFSLFCGLMGKHPFDAGVKFSIELDQHL